MAPRIETGETRRLERGRSIAAKVEELEAIAKRCAKPMGPGPHPDHGDLLYDERGLPKRRRARRGAVIPDRLQINTFRQVARRFVEQETMPGRPRRGARNRRRSKTCPSPVTAPPARRPPRG